MMVESRGMVTHRCWECQKYARLEDSVLRRHSMSGIRRYFHNETSEPACVNDIGDDWEEVDPSLGETTEEEEFGLKLTDYVTEVRDQVLAEAGIAMPPDITKATDEKAFTPGTMLLADFGRFRYAHAGAPLKADRPAYHTGEGVLPQDASGHFIVGQEQSEALWSNLQPEGEERLLMGQPVVDVEQGQYFWLRVRF